MAAYAGNKLNLKNVRDGNFFCSRSILFALTFLTFFLLYLSVVWQTFNSKLFSLNTLRTRTGGNSKTICWPCSDAHRVANHFVHVLFLHPFGGAKSQRKR